MQAVKARAKAMMETLNAQGGHPVLYSDCLHELSLQAGYDRWNDYSAALRAEAGLRPRRRVKVRRTRHQFAPTPSLPTPLSLYARGSFWDVADSEAEA
ncbi:hypothetical protein [Deinococcus multiflagellatus]|uniref:Transposase n=1 Tax=Deinococcus multiflagellatus TaxID=1656887 RepID=A0ABW1ZT88_9DEIO|nr:hypothetical protein [Deinococcus multiflagellatus]MBZ9715339.1 hypothetical protein [Deinococcus multiflagellatus]